MLTRRILRSAFPLFGLLALTSIANSLARSAPSPMTDKQPVQRGYYRYPAIHGDTIVFNSEGDLWSVDVHGGPARRLTSNLSLIHI